jgi:prophage antirepressor-like protein
VAAVNQLQIFSYEGNEVRTVQKDGETWWVLKDVCDVLDINNSRMVADRLDDDEKGVSITDTLGGKQELTIVSESGLYSVILLSRKPEAKKFKRWVTHEVLPSIRKHGVYATPAKIEELLNDPKSWIKVLTALEEERTAKEKAARQLEEKTVQLDESKQWYTIKRMAKLTGRNWRSFDWRKLKNTSDYLGYPIRKIFDANYGEVNAYHIDVWRQEYSGLRFREEV